MFYFDTLFYARRDDIEFLENGCDERVDVRLLLPRISPIPGWLTHWCTRSYVEELVGSRCKDLLVPQKGINHSKGNY